MTVEWTPVALATGWSEWTPFGVYEHRGRVYIEGTFSNFDSVDDGGPDVPTVLGSIPPELAPAVVVTLTCYAESTNTQPPNPPQFDVHISPMGGITLDGGPLRPDRLAFAGVANGSWPMKGSSEVDDIAFTEVSGIPTCLHGNRLHLDGSVAVLFDPPTVVAQVGTDMLPSNYAPQPGDINAGIVRQMVVPCTDTLREVLVDFLDTGLFQVQDAYAQNTAHLTIDAADMRTFADHGGWGGTAYTSPFDEIYVANRGSTDIVDPVTTFVFTHNVRIDPLAAVDTPDSGGSPDPTWPTPGFALCLHDSGFSSNSYYKLGYVQQSGFWWLTLWRIDNDAGSAANIVEIGSSNHQALGTVEFTVSMFAVVTNLATFGPRDGFDTGLHIQIPSDNNIGFTSVFNDTLDDIGANAGFLSQFPGDQGLLTDGNTDGTSEGFVPLTLEISNTGAEISAYTPDDGASVDLTNQGWYANGPDSIGTIGASSGGIVPLGGTRI